jgi:serine/threonine protein kinase
MQIVHFVFGTMLVLVVATGAWMVWSAHRDLRGRTGRGKSSRPTVDDEALAAKLAGSIWTRLAELKDSGIQLSLRSRLEATAGAPVAERLLVLQEVLLDLERLHPGRPLLSHSGSARSGGTPSGEVLELLKLPPDQRSGFIGRAIVAGIEPLLASCMGPRSAEAFFRAMGPLPGSVDEWSKWMEKGFLADLFARMLEWSKSSIGPEALLKILEQSASAVGAKFPLACFPAILARFPEGLLAREKIACAVRETLWQELSAEAAGDATSFGGYMLHHLIAEGGMGQVFLAEKKGAQEFRKVLVLKRMLPHLSQRPGFVAMFLEEARIVSMLAHPNIVQVFDFGEFNGAYYLAMEYLPGENLAVLIEEAERTGLRVPVQVALQVLVYVCDGLHYVHEFGAGETPLHLIHRDVSPTNIVVTYQGGVKLLDFGVARAVDRKDLTAPGLVKGKLAYCSPEQLGGAEMDRRSDIFSLGAVMFEILTGKQLFVRATEMATYRAVAAGEAPPPSSLRPEVPPEVDRIVGKALRVSPDDRYQTAREMRGDLERLLTSPAERIDDYLVRLFGKDRMLERIDVLSLRRRSTPVTPWSATPSPSTLSAPGGGGRVTAEIAPELQVALADRYVLERELGRGGMATVYLARDLRHDRQVALKVLHTELAEASDAERRFLREIRTAARLEHPHILPVLDSGAAGQRAGIRGAGDGTGVLWYTMPYVAGESLRDRLRREGQLAIEDAVRLGREVADALEYAHAHGIVHRDIKPGNILLSGGHARVADFGIARALEAAGGETLTVSGVVVGTPAYMSPEQATGGIEVDGRSDVYSLGCMLYEMLAGEPPWSGPTPLAALTKRLTEDLRPLGTIREGIPEQLDQAVARAVAREPSERFQTAGEFAQALAGGTFAYLPRPVAPAVQLEPWRR